MGRRLRGFGPGFFLACLVSGCTAASPGHPASQAPLPLPGIQVTVSASSCGTGWHNPVAGLQTFQVRNASAAVVEVSLTDAETGGVFARIEGLAPGTTRPMQVNIGSGEYAFECDTAGGSPLSGPTTRVPGNTPGAVAVIPASVTDTVAAVSSERAYVQGQLGLVSKQAGVLQSDIQAGNLPAARQAWLTAHLSYERLGSAYGMFGDFDDEIDGTASGLKGGVADPSFTGFYRIEYGLWHGQSAAELAAPARQLVTDLYALRTAYPGLVPYPQKALSDLALRTHEILEHAIRAQLSGADDYGSGTTLATTSANIDATITQLGMLHTALAARYPALPTVYQWLGRLQKLVDAQHSPQGWTPVSTLTTTERENIDSAAAECVQLLAPIAVLFESDPNS